MAAAILAIDRQPGKLWKFLRFPVTRIVLAAAALVAVDVIIQAGAKALHIAPSSPANVLIALLLVVAVVAVYCTYVRMVERRAVTEFSPSRAVPEFVSGFLVGVLLFGITMLVMWRLGIASFTMAGGWRALGYPLLGALVAGVVEETLVRGVLFRIIEESLGSWVALIISAVVFGALHAFNPGATIVSSIAIALEAGVLLAAVFMYTRRLWMVIGLHAAWNFTEGGIFGASVSGSSARGMLASHFQGAQWLTGGKFGPEASVIAVLVCLAAGIGFVFLAYRKGNIVRPVWCRAEQLAGNHA